MIYYGKTLFGCGPKLTAVQVSYSHLLDTLSNLRSGMVLGIF
jgi:hypothetical protein